MLYKYLPHFGLVLALMLMGCAAGRDVAWPEPRPLGSDIIAYRPPLKPSGAGSEPLKIEELTGRLTLRQALSLALMRNPELAAFSWEVRAREARVLQAGLLPNPEFETEVEEFGGSGERSDFDGAETSLRLGQLIELGGKRPKRKRVATLQRDLGGWDYESKRLDVFTQTTKTFIEMLAAQEQLALSENSFRLAKRVLEVVSERVKAGKVSPLEETKAKVALSTSGIEFERAKRDLGAARKGLAASWGSTTPTFNRVEGQFETISEIPPLDQLLQDTYQNPNIARWKTEIEMRQATIELEQARRIPDPIISAGVQRFEETDDNAFIVGLSIPLPLFNRNQGGILEARHQLAKAIEEQRATDIQVETSLSQTHEALSTSYFEAVTLKKDVLPAAQSAFDAAREGYEMGKFGFLEVLDAQRTLFQVRGQYIGALAAYHKTVADAERLVGQRLDATKAPTPIPKESGDEE